MGFLTLLPVGSTSLEGVFYFFPTVGLFIGFLEVLLLKLLPFSPLLSSSLTLCFYVILTGGLHIDGLVDSFDAMAHGRSSEERLRIMKDSHIGTYGSLSLFFILTLKLLLLREALIRKELPAVLLSPSYGRWSVVFLGSLFPPARKDGLGFLTVEELSKKRYLLPTTLFILSFSLFYPKSLFALLSSSIFLYLFGSFWKKRIGGVTGDVFGCSIELVDTLSLSSMLLWRF